MAEAIECTGYYIPSDTTPRRFSMLKSASHEGSREALDDGHIVNFSESGKFEHHEDDGERLIVDLRRTIVVDGTEVKVEGKSLNSIKPTNEFALKALELIDFEKINLED